MVPVYRQANNCPLPSQIGAVGSDLLLRKRNGHGTPWLVAFPSQFQYYRINIVK